MSMRLYVGNIPFTTTEEGLRAIFEEYGDVEDLAMMYDRETGRPRGFAFVTMPDDAAKKATEELDGADFEGRPLKVNEAKPREDRGGGGGYRGGGGGGRGGYGGGGGGGRGGYGGGGGGGGRGGRDRGGRGGGDRW
ncbi:MAG: RNA-binding protein [Planctomycetota bacterium]